MNRALTLSYRILIEDSPSFSVEYAQPGTGSACRVTVPSWTAEQLQSVADEVVANPGWTSLPYSRSVEGGYAVRRIASFDFYDDARRGEFEAFVDGFFDSIAAAGVHDLILDLRGNGGGNPYCAAFLFARLVSKEFVYFSAATPGYSDLKAVRPARNGFSGALYVLIDGGCFSTTGHLCSLLRTLSCTGLQLKLSRTVYATAVSGLPPGRGILPDHEVLPTIAERLAGFDAPMAFARHLVESGVEARCTMSPGFRNVPLRTVGDLGRVYSWFAGLETPSLFFVPALDEVRGEAVAQMS